MGNQRIKFDLLIHDLKVPLAVIEAGVTSLLERMEKYGPLTEKQIKVLNRVLRNTKVTKTLVNDAMEVGRSTQGIISRDRFLMSEFLEHSFQEIFDLTDQSTADRIKECVGLKELRETLASKGIVLHMDETLWSRRICLDQSKITQILRNLLNNALKYKRERVEISIADRGDALRMAVKDDGQGIPASYHQQIFECYFQMETGREHCVRGHGLGLAGVSVLVEDLKGELALESDEGCGATFLVTVPYAL